MAKPGGRRRQTRHEMIGQMSIRMSIPSRLPTRGYIPLVSLDYREPTQLVYVEYDYFPSVHRRNAWNAFWHRLLALTPEELRAEKRRDLVHLLLARLISLQAAAADRERYLRWLWNGDPPADVVSPPPRRRQRRPRR